MSTTPAPVNQDQLLQYIQQMATQGANTQGMTNVAPQVPANPVRPPAPHQNQPQQPIQAVGAGQGEAMKAQVRQNFGIQLQNTIGQISNAIATRKARQESKVFDNFALYTKGKADAEAQMKDAAAAVQKDPNDKDAQQRLEQARVAYKQNVENLNDLTSGKNEKNAKLLAKGYGIDDKNAGTPERQMAIAAYKKANPEANDKVAGIMSKLPQTQQLTPQAQGQAMAKQAGAQQFKPATGGQILAAAGKQVDQQIKTEALLHKIGHDTDSFIASLPNKGLKAVMDEDGDPKRREDGSIVTENLTSKDLENNPVLFEKKQKIDEQVQLMKAQAQSTLLRAKVAMVKEQRLKQEKQDAANPNVVSAWTKQITDPTSGVTIANVPAAARSAVLSDVSQKGLKISKPLNSEEIKRMDLANNAVKNIERMQDIVKKRPDLFGASGWGHNKFEYAFAGGDPDALDFQAASKLAGLPLVGIHGVRGKYAIEDIDNMTGDFWLSPDSMNGVLGELHRSAGEFQKLAGRGPQLGGASDAIVVSPEDMQ